MMVVMSALSLSCSAHVEYVNDGSDVCTVRSRVLLTWST
jgi:hypothetical protein